MTTAKPRTTHRIVHWLEATTHLALIEALDAVPRAELAAKQALWEQECGNQEALAARTEAMGHELQAANERAEAAEAKLEVAREGLRQALERHGEEQARAEAAEAKLAAVEEALASIDTEKTRELAERHSFEFGLLEAVSKVRAALNPAPFELPTEIPARVEARDKDDQLRRFELWTSGEQSLWMDEDGELDPLRPEDLRDAFTEHRLIGAEQ